MTPSLLDTNVLIALLWPSHQDHQTAVRWFAANRSKGWATCPVTEAYLVGLAIARGGRLATMDRALGSLTRDGSSERAAIATVRSA